MTLLISLLLACGAPSAPHDHDHDEAHAHEAEGGHAHEAPKPAATGRIEAPLGVYTARLEPSADALALTVVDAEGEPVPAAGEARVMLTPTGGEPQRVVLTASGDRWTGPAKASGAPGYLAVVNVEIGGAKESARLTWGEVPEVAPAPEPHDHAQGGHDAGGGHDHGRGGHTH